MHGRTRLRPSLASRGRDGSGVLQAPAFISISATLTSAFKPLTGPHGLAADVWHPSKHHGARRRTIVKYLMPLRHNDPRVVRPDEFGARSPLVGAGSQLTVHEASTPGSLRFRQLPTPVVTTHGPLSRRSRSISEENPRSPRKLGCPLRRSHAPDESLSSRILIRPSCPPEPKDHDTAVSLFDVYASTLHASKTRS